MITAALAVFGNAFSRDLEFNRSAPAMTLAAAVMLLFTARTWDAPLLAGNPSGQPIVFRQKSLKGTR